MQSLCRSTTEVRSKRVNNKNDIAGAAVVQCRKMPQFTAYNQGRRTAGLFGNSSICSQRTYDLEEVVQHRAHKPLEVGASCGCCNEFKSCAWLYLRSRTHIHPPSLAYASTASCSNGAIPCGSMTFCATQTQTVSYSCLAVL